MFEWTENAKERIGSITSPPAMDPGEDLKQVKVNRKQDASRFIDFQLRFALHLQKHRREAAMPKSESLTIRLDPSVREVLRSAAERERRSVSNMVEVMIVEYGRRLGIEESKVRPSRKTRQKTK